MRASISNQTTHFGIMGGLYTRKISGRSSTHRATSRLIIPSPAKLGMQFMQKHNLLSKNPQGSGGIGKVVKHNHCNCNLAKTLTVPDINADANSEQTKDLSCGTAGDCSYVVYSGNQPKTYQGCYIDTAKNFCCTQDGWDGSGCKDRKYVCQKKQYISLCNGPEDAFDECTGFGSYMCNSDSGICYFNRGGGQDRKNCKESCHPSLLFTCDTSTGTCNVTPNGKIKDECQKTCTKM